MRTEKRYYFKFFLLTVGLLLFISCKNWQYDVVKEGIHFKKIRQNASGGYTGYMTENHQIHGFPCEKGWIHFKDDGSLESFQLSEEFWFNGTLLPANTWIHYWTPESIGGYVCAFPYDYKVQGYLCGGSGGYKGTHTGFYDSGKLRSFYPPDNVVVDSVPCEASLLVNVQLYENGSIKRCKLAADYEHNGKIYKKGSTIIFGKKGNVK